MNRRKLIPHSTSAPPRKFSVLKGISVVAVPLTTKIFAADSHNPSQLGATMESFTFGACSSTTSPSRSVPSGFTSKTYPLRWLSVGSMISAKLSSRSCEMSRRNCVATILLGSES